MLVPGSAPGMFLPPESIVRFSSGPPIQAGKPGQGPSEGSQPWTFWAFQVAPYQFKWSKPVGKSFGKHRGKFQEYDEFLGEL